MNFYSKPASRFISEWTSQEENFRSPLHCTTAKKTKIDTPTYRHQCRKDTDYIPSCSYCIIVWSHWIVLDCCQKGLDVWLTGWNKKANQIRSLPNERRSEMTNSPFSEFEHDWKTFDPSQRLLVVLGSLILACVCWCVVSCICNCIRDICFSCTGGRTRTTTRTYYSPRSGGYTEIRTIDNSRGSSAGIRNAMWTACCFECCCRDNQDFDCCSICAPLCCVEICCPVW